MFEPSYASTPGYGYQVPTYAPPAPAPTGPLDSRSCKLLLRQQPHEALVTLQGKEKVRKPVDPPPILEMSVDPRADPNQQFLQNPYLFVCATLYKPDEDEPHEMSTDKSLAGTLVSSLHRLKDVSNKDGGFFVFGDISIKVQGSFRLCFTLYEFQQHHVQHLASVISDKFKVLPAKDFKGLEESTYLSRAFSDQGVRLRLRKEPRSALHKRSYPCDHSPASNAPLRPNTDQTEPLTKRSRQEYAGVHNPTPSMTRLPPTSVTPNPSSAIYHPTTNYTSTANYSTSMSHVPSTSISHMPSTSMGQMPSISMGQMHSTSMGQMHPSSISHVPSTSMDQRPQSSMSQLSSGSITGLPLSGISQLPYNTGPPELEPNMPQWSWGGYSSYPT